MSGVLLVGVLLAGLAGLGYGLHGRWLHARAVRRLHGGAVDEPEEEPPTPELPAPSAVVARYRAAPWVAGAAAAAVLLVWVGLDPLLGLAASAVVGTLVWLTEAWNAGRQTARLEAQLADAIDLMVGALRAGAGLLDALESAGQEVRPPLRTLFEQTVDRIRLGDDPVETFQDLADRVPLETFSLFAATLTVHWEVGGSLAGTLATVGQAIRERNEISRRVRAQSTQARASVVGILAIVYLLGAGSWVANPDRVGGFLTTGLGSFLVAFTVLLQAAGLLWIARLSRVEV